MYGLPHTYKNSALTVTIKVECRHLSQATTFLLLHLLYKMLCLAIIAIAATIFVPCLAELDDGAPVTVGLVKYLGEFPFYPATSSLFETGSIGSLNSH